MCVIAKRGSGTNLIALEHDAEKAMQQARVLDTGRMILHRASNLHSILARGYWEPEERGDQTLQALLATAADADAPRRSDSVAVTA
jgi:hypothetical protein